ncbi:MAG: hypothetical protein JW928_01345 [Candidatus Aureabacteria bacterium]|nr:hypothetical protein [Candidatus Auribacterota bacterium]
MRRKTLHDILTHIEKRSPALRWPYPFATPQSIAGAMAVACGLDEDPFLNLLNGKIPGAQTSEEILKRFPSLRNQDLKDIFIRWTKGSPFHQGTHIRLSSELLFSLRHSLQKTFSSYESIDTLMLLGFGENVFPVSTFLKSLFFSYHLFDSSSTYEDIQACLKSVFPQIQDIMRIFLAIKRIDCLSDRRKKLVMESIQQKIHLTCSNCGADIHMMKNPVIADITLYPSRNTIITQDDLEKDFQREWEKIIQESGSLSQEDMEKQVFVQYRLFLCSSCRARFTNRIERGEIF